MAFQVNNSVRNNRNNNNQTEETSEFDGLWINVGVIANNEETGESKFNRLPRGIAISDLQDHRIYQSSNDEWKQEATLINLVMDQIREKASQLEEGESVAISLDCQLYRKQNEVSAAKVDKNLSASVADKLFG